MLLLLLLLQRSLAAAPAVSDAEALRRSHSSRRRRRCEEFVGVVAARGRLDDGDGAVNRSGAAADCALSARTSHAMKQDSTAAIIAPLSSAIRRRRIAGKDVFSLSICFFPPPPSMSERRAIFLCCRPSLRTPDSFFFPSVFRKLYKRRTGQ